MVEQECIAALYQSLGVSVGGEFSAEDVNVLFHKVFHLPSSVEDVHMAIKKIAGDGEGWLCVGEKVLDVLLEMERETERKNELYWDLQLRNAWTDNTLHTVDTRDTVDRQALNYTLPATDTTTFKLDSFQSHPLHKYLSQTLAGKPWQEMNGWCVRRLKRAARQCWARLVAEGVHKTWTFEWQGKGPEVRGQAWGYVSLSELILLVEVKYDVVTSMLYTEMLEEHYGLTVWDHLLPWQRDKVKEGLEGLAEEALDLGDLLRVAELPGAFRIYRVREGVSFKDGVESREQSWSAITVLTDLHTSRQEEIHTLTALSKRLDKEALRLVCLYIRLATFRAQREKTSYGALLAARQSWKTWPCISSPCKTEQTALWAQNIEEESEKEHFISMSPQQAVLQWLVLSHEQERKYLLRLLRGVSLEHLQGAGDLETPGEGEDKQGQAALRDGCVRRLRQIHNILQMHIQSQIQPAERSHQSPTLSQSSPTHQSLQIQTKVQTFSSPERASPAHLEACALVLLSQLMELQEAHVSVILPTLQDMSVEYLQGLRNEYQCERQELRLSNLINLLTSDDPVTLDRLHMNTPPTAQETSTGQVTDQICDTAVIMRSISSESNPIQNTASLERHDLCTGCGATIEDLPYLEILSKNVPPDGRGAQEEQGSPSKTPQVYEKQGSLITLAWSKPPEESTDRQAETAVRSKAQCSMPSVEEPANTDSLDWHTHREDTPGDRHIEVSDTSSSRSATGMPLRDQQYRTVAQLESVAPEELHIGDQRDTSRESPSDNHLETSDNVQTLSLVCSLEPKGRTDDQQTNESANGSVAMGRVDMELCPIQPETEMWDVEVSEDRIYTTPATIDSIPEREVMEDSVMTEQERTRDTVSVLERERTMRSLVDTQKKVEQKQQRDRERQLLRVQERLSIVHNRKAEEDVLGLKHKDTLRHVTHNLPQEDKSQQKTVVRERLEQLRRERSYVMQSKRDRNTAGFKELLGPAALHGSEMEDGVD